MTKEMWSKLEAEAERVAVEMAHEYAGGLPLDLHFRTTVTSYYSNGKVYETNHFSTPVTKMSWAMSECEKHGWSMSYNADEKTFTFEKHFPNGMYRIATYEPYNKDAVEIDMVDGGSEHNTFRVCCDR